MRTDAGGMRIGGNDDFAERVLMLLRSGKKRRFAGAGQSKAGNNPRQFPGDRVGQVKALRSDFEDGRKTLPQSEAKVRRPDYGFAEDLARKRAQTCPAASTAAVHTK